MGWRQSATDTLFNSKSEPAFEVASKRWQHLETCQYRTIWVADIPRVKRKECGWNYGPSLFFLGNPHSSNLVFF